MIKYISALVLTVIIEFIVIWVFIRNKPLRLLAYSALINSFTLPVAIYTYQNIFNNFLLIELFVFLIEIFLIKLLLKVKYSKAIILSFTANFITAIISFLF